MSLSAAHSTVRTAASMSWKLTNAMPARRRGFWAQKSRSHRL